MNLGNSKKQLTKNVFSLTIVQIATYVLPLISVPIISRIIGPDKFGVINFAAAYIVYFNLLIGYSFDFTATRKIAREPDNEATRNKVFSEVFYTQCLLFIFSSIVFIILLYTVPELKHNKTIVIYSFFICVAALFTQNWLFQAMQDLSKVAIFNLISRLLFSICILVLVKKQEDYIWQPLLIGVIQTLVAIWSFVWAYKRYNIKLLKLPLTNCFQVLWQERMIFFSLVFVNLYTSTNTFILGLNQNPEQVGYFTAGQRLIVIAQSVLAIPLTQALYPFIGKAFGDSREKGLIIVQKLAPIIVLIFGLASILMFLFGPFLILLFYGEKFAPAISVFQVQSTIPLIIALSNILGIQIMMNLGMDKLFFRITALAGFISITLNLLTVKRWGYLASSYNYIFTEIFILVIMYIVLRRQGLNAINSQFWKVSEIMKQLKPISKMFSAKQKL